MTVLAATLRYAWRPICPVPLHAKNSRSRSGLFAYRAVIVTTPRSMRMINTTTMISATLLIIDPR